MKFKKAGSLKKISKIEKFVARLTKIKREDTNPSNQKQGGNITMDMAAIKRTTLCW